MKFNTIEQFLRSTNSRLSNGDKWLVYTICWKVYWHPSGAKNVTILYEGDDLKEALEILGQDSE